ncbi:MAG: hypothetical protein OEV99_03815 [Nitrospira sp.]|nr:hypothetical protein [Nitrospira sp.]MDH4368947.1 hypothetical protein [Nitrospira sp.]
MWACPLGKKKIGFPRLLRIGEWARVDDTLSHQLEKLDLIGQVVSEHLPDLGRLGQADPSAGGTPVFPMAEPGD